MYQSTEPNVEFTFEQQKQLAEWKQRLAVVHDEMLVREERIKSLKGDIASAVREHDYRNGIVETLGKDIDAMTAQKADFALALEKMRVLLESQQREHRDAEASLGKKIDELAFREQAVAQSEANVAEVRQNLAKSSLAIEEDKASVAKAKGVLQKAVEDIWSR